MWIGIKLLCILLVMHQQKMEMLYPLSKNLQHKNLARYYQSIVLHVVVILLENLSIYIVQTLHHIIS